MVDTMKFLRYFTVSVLMFLPGWAQEKGVFEGRLSNGASGQSLAGVIVELRGQQAFVSRTTTNEYGEFRIIGLKPGQYTPSFEKTGYYRSDALPLSDSRFQIDGSETVRRNPQMLPWRTVRGRVIDPAGEPVPQAHLQLGHRGDEAITDEKGQFSFEKVSSGYYTLLARPAPNSGVQDGQRVAAVPTYYPSAIESSQAVRFLVQSGADPPEIEVRLRSAAVYRVRGVVLGPDGKPSRNATVRLLRPADRNTQRYAEGYQLGASYIVLGPQSASEALSVSSGADGMFEFDCVRPGDWRIQANSFPYEDSVRNRALVYNGNLSVKVSKEDIEDLEVRMRAPFDQEFSVEWGGPTPKPVSQSPSISLAPLDAQQGGTPGAAAFEDVLPGRYLISPAPVVYGSGDYVASVLHGSREVLGLEVDLAPGSSPLRIIKRTTGAVRGVTEKGQEAIIVLTPQELPNGGVGVIWIIQSGKAGRFEFPHIVPGDYIAAAFTSVDTPALTSPEFMGAVKSASQVRVEESSTSFLELRVNSWPW